MISRLHEWPASTCLSLFVIGIYIITMALGWANPKKPTAWEGLWGTFFRDEYFSALEKHSFCKSNATGFIHPTS
jgi:hypothetical protein